MPNLSLKEVKRRLKRGSRNAKYMLEESRSYRLVLPHVKRHSIIKAMMKCAVEEESNTIQLAIEQASRHRLARGIARALVEARR